VHLDAADPDFPGGGPGPAASAPPRPTSAASRTSAM
jgi:hypothetical protein